MDWPRTRLHRKQTRTHSNSHAPIADFQDMQTKHEGFFASKMFKGFSISGTKRQTTLQSFLRKVMETSSVNGQSFKDIQRQHVWSVLQYQNNSEVL